MDRTTSAAILLWAGLGILGPVVAAFSLRLGAGVCACAAGLTGLSLAALAWGSDFGSGISRRPLQALTAALAALLTATVLLPFAGLRVAGLAGLALCLAGWLKIRRSDRSESVAPPAWALALIGAATVAWARCLGLLWGHSFYAVCGLMIAAGVGLSGGFWLRSRFASARQATDLPRGVWLLASGLAGLLGLSWLRFIGINSGDPEYLFSPLRGPQDLAFIVAQSAAAPALWYALLAFAWDTGRNENGPLTATRKTAAAMLAAAGPLAAWLLIARLGAAETAAACHWLLAAAGLISIGPWRLAQKPILIRIAAASLCLAAILAWQSRGLFHDIWLNRLNAAWTGGRFLALVEDGREMLGVYRFSSGTKVLLRDGASWADGVDTARREAHLPLLLHGSAHRVLILGARQPATITAALAHGVELTLVDPHPGAGSILAAQTAQVWPPPLPPNGASLNLVRADLRRYLRARGPVYDVIILELPFPAPTPEWSRLATTQAFQELRARLAPNGIVAVRFPAPYPPRSFARTLRTARAVFASIGGFDLSGGYLLVCCDQKLAMDPTVLLSRRSAAVESNDQDLATALPSLRWDDLTALPPAAAAQAPDTDDRPSGFFPLPDLLRGLTLVHRPAMVLP